MKYSAPYRGALKIQRLIEADTLKATGKELALLARAFVSLEMLKLRLRMKPAPKPIDTTKIDKASTRQRLTLPNFTEH